MAVNNMSHSLFSQQINCEKPLDILKQYEYKSVLN